jgi:hypothetical protein
LRALLGVSLAAALAPGATAVAASAVAGATGSKAASRAESELIGAEQRRFDAQVAGDLSKLGAALADELVYIHGSGDVWNKDDYLQGFRSGTMHYAGIDILEQQGRVYGNVGITHGLLTLHMSADVTHLNRYTGVYVKRAGRWQLISWQTTDKK